MSRDTRPAARSERLAALVAQCARQRVDAAHEVRSLFAPATGAQLMAGRWKLPLTIAGVVLGMIATRSGRAMPMLTAGLGLWKMVSKVMPLLRLLRRKV
jgi:hypothetical protein